MNNKFDNNTSEKNQPIWENLKKLKKQLLTAFSDNKFDDETLIELEDVLIMADTGPKAAKEIIANLSEQVSEDSYENSKSARLHLADIINKRLNRLCPNESISITKNKLTVFLLVGVNGSGKTTTIGKLAHHFKNNGSKVALAACDTFRAAAKDQLNIWGEENGVTVFSSERSDPSSVAFEAVTNSIEQNIDILLVDTAGRLPSKKNLIEWNYEFNEKKNNNSYLKDFNKMILKSFYLKKIFRDYNKKGIGSDQFKNNVRDPKTWGDGKNNKKKFLESAEGRIYIKELSKIKKMLKEKYK